MLYICYFQDELRIQNYRACAFLNLTYFQPHNPSFRQLMGSSNPSSKYNLTSPYSPSFTSSAFPFPPTSTSPSSTLTATSPFPSSSSYTAFPFPSSSTGYNPLLPQQPLPRQEPSKETPRMHNGKKVKKREIRGKNLENTFCRCAAPVQFIQPRRSSTWRPGVPFVLATSFILPF